MLALLKYGSKALVIVMVWASVSPTSAAAQTVNSSGGWTDCTDVEVEYVDDPNLTDAERLARMDAAFQRSLSQFDFCSDAQQDNQDQIQTNQDTASDGSPSDARITNAAQASANQSNDGISASDAIDAAQAAANAAAQGTSQGDGQSNSDAASQAAQAAAAAANAANAVGASTGTAASGTGAASSGSSQPTNSVATSDIAGTEQSPSIGQGGIGQSGTRSDGISQGSVASSDVQGMDKIPQAPTIGGGADGINAQGQTTAGVGAGSPDGTVTGNVSGQRVLKNGKLPDDIPPADNDSVLEAQIRQAAINEPDPVVQKKLWNEYRKYKGLPTVK